jgi:hypothetical protein
MTNEERLMQRLQIEKEARIIAERRARAFSQANQKLREKLAALSRLKAGSRRWAVTAECSMSRWGITAGRTSTCGA